MAVDLAKLVVRLEAETAKYQAELERARLQLTKFDKDANVSLKNIGKAAAAAGAVVAGAFVVMAKAAINEADALHQLSQSTGVAVEDLSSLGYAAGLSGVSVEELGSVLAKLSKTTAAAADGSGSAADAFRAIGVSVKNADGSLRATDEILLDVADRFSQYEDGAAKAALAQEIFGKSGAALIPFLNQGRAGIEDLRKEAERLGLVIGSDTAAAADELNDNLDRVKAVAVGLTNQIVSQLLPSISAYSTEMIDSAKASGTFEKAAQGVAIVLKSLLTIGVLVGEVFDQIGHAIGANAAVLVALANKDFKGAWQIIKEAGSDAVASGRETGAQIAAIWSDTGKAIEDTAKRTDAEVKKTLTFGGDANAIAEVRVSALKIEQTATEQFYEELHRLTRTQTETAIAGYNEQKAALDFLFDEGIVKAEQYNQRLAEMQDELLPPVEITAKKIYDIKTKSADDVSEYERQAARNTQDIIASTLRSGAEGGARGVLKVFADMLLDLSSQALAANISGKIFGQAGGGSGGGWLQLAASFFGFGGTRDSGGRGEPGKAYMIGRKAQPEMFVPDQPGRFIPADQMKAQAPNVTFKPTFVTVKDPKEIPTVIQSGEADEAIINVIGRNPSVVRNLLQG